MILRFSGQTAALLQKEQDITAVCLTEVSLSRRKVMINLLTLMLFLSPKMTFMVPACLFIMLKDR